MSESKTRAEARESERRNWFQRHPRYSLIGAVVLVLVLIGVAASFGKSDTSANPSDSASASAPVLEVGALSGPAGEALLWLRLQGKVSSDLQWLQYTDQDGMVESFLQSQAQALVVPAGTTLPDGVSVVGKLFTVSTDGTDQTMELVARDADVNNAQVQNLLKMLRAQETLDYLNTLSGVKVSSAS